MNKSTGDSNSPASQKPASAAQPDARKKRLAEQLRQNLHRRKAQSRLRRNIDKPEDE